MVIAVKLRLTKAFLGDRPADNRGVRKIQMENGRVKFTEAQWQERFQKAARELGLNISVATITPPKGIVPANIRLYPRRHSGARVDLFESFQKGATLTMHFLIDSENPKAPTAGQFRLMLVFIGEWLGLTQWGAGAFGFGTFIVESAEPINHENYVSQYL